METDDVFGEGDPFAEEMAAAEKTLVADRSVGMRAPCALAWHWAEGDLAHSILMKPYSFSTVACMSAAPSIAQICSTNWCRCYLRMPPEGDRPQEELHSPPEARGGSVRWGRSVKCDCTCTS